jgi:hypothetical protein
VEIRPWLECHSNRIIVLEEGKVGWGEAAKEHTGHSRPGS